MRAAGLHGLALAAGLVLAPCGIDAQEAPSSPLIEATPAPNTGDDDRSPPADSETPPPPSEGPESFEIGLSTDRIGIASDFNGADLVVFGALDNADGRILRQQRYDIVVVLFGPRHPVVVREKTRQFGIWINSDSETFNAAPASYALASTRPLGDITPFDLRKRLSIGVEALRLSVAEPGTEAAAASGAEAEAAAEPEAGGGPPTDPEIFGMALRRIRLDSGVYSQSIGGVRFVGPSLFRADLRLPADLPTGRHTVRAFLFRNGEFVRQNSEELTVVKVGFEAWIDRFATRYGYLYGVIAVLLAVFTGWIGRLVFKRD